MIRRALFGGVALVLACFTAYETHYWWSDESLFTRAVEQDPGYVEGRAGLAALALNRGDHQAAVEHSQLALESAADSTYASYWSPFTVHTNLALGYHRLGQYDDAEEHFIKAQEARPNNAISHYHLGLNAFSQRDLPRAQRHYMMALRLNPDDFLTKSNLGYVYLLMGRTDDCFGVLQPLTTERPDDLLNRSNLGTAYLLAGKYLDAELQFKQLVERQHDTAVSLAKLAWAEWKQRKSEEALDHIRAASDLQPDHPTVRHVQEMVLTGASTRSTGSPALDTPPASAVP